MPKKSLMLTGLALLLVALAACSGVASTPAPTAEAALASPTTSGVDNTAESTVEADPTAEATQSVQAEAASTSEAAACAKLDLNTLTNDQLMATIPDFSSRMVREFLEYRPYVSIQQFRREIGKYVDETQIADYEQYVYVPIDPNQSDADTLMQIPGVDDTLAETLIAGRPYADNQAFLDALGGSLDVGQLAQAGCYLAIAS